MGINDISIGRRVWTYSLARLQPISGTVIGVNPNKVRNVLLKTDAGDTLDCHDATECWPDRESVTEFVRDLARARVTNYRLLLAQYERDLAALEPAPTPDPEAAVIGFDLPELNATLPQ